MAEERATATPRQSRARPPGRVLPALLLALFAALAVQSLRQKSVTTDELTYIAAGYHALRTGRVELNLTNPPGLKILAGLPLLALDLKLPPAEGNLASWNELEQWRYARRFLYHNRVDADRILLLARLPFVALGLVLGAFVHRWARRLYGPRAALLALLLYALSPNVLAHTRLATLDLGLGAGWLLTLYFTWSFVVRPALRPLLAAGASLGAALLAKTTALFLLPVLGAYGLLLLLRSDAPGIWTRLPAVARIDPSRRRLRQAVSLGVAGVTMGFAALFVVNAAYGFRGSFAPLSSKAAHPALYRRLPVDLPATRALADAVVAAPFPLPAAYVNVLKFQAGRAARGNGVYFAGRRSSTGWYWMTAAACAIKTPLPLLLLLAATGVALLRHPRRANHAEWLLALSVGCLFLVFSYLRQSAVGLRYVLPAYPLLHLLASRALRAGAPPRRWGMAALALLGLWYGVEAARIHPHYLAYFSELVGGPRNGYRWLADSYLDWGQDLKGLKKYLAEHDIDRIRLAYFGSADARYYDIDYEYLPSVGLAPRRPGERWWYEAKPQDLPPLELAGGPIAVSATLLAGVFYPGYYAPLRRLEPVDQVGYSILIFEPDASAPAPPLRATAGSVGEAAR